MYSLNMFKSDFELGAKHEDKSAFHATWNHPAVLEALHRKAGDRPTFLLHDGPPYANGHLHMGHFVNKTLKDAVLKYKRLAGYFAPFVPGFDCHGLPVELEVEKLGYAKTDPVEFVRACRAYAERQVDLQTSEFKDFGVSADWDLAYRTMESAFEAGVGRTFLRLPQLVQRLRPVHWCPLCGSSLAEAEVEHKPKTSDSLEVLFPLVPVEGERPTSLLVWTTTPYTLPANVAVGFHPGFDYVQVEDAGGVALVRLRRETDPVDLPTVDLTGRQAVSPWTGEHVPLLAADFVTASGTGLVHLAPAFGMDDFRVCEAHGLTVEHFVDEKGRFLNGELAGMGLKEASMHVLATLAARSLVFSHTTVQHEYPHCWRHKKPVFFKASQEWFLDLSDVTPKALQALEHVSFTPEAGRERLTSMLKSRGSWCLSRNRLWGSPLAQQADTALLARVESEGLEAWHAEGTGRTLDVWFDSGVTHELVLRERFGRTADLYLEGSDQHRGWFQSSLLTSVSLHGTAPFKELLTHGFVVDEHGRKYSKSSGNYLQLSELFKRYSPDVLRLWALSQDYTRDLKMSQVSLDRTLERYRKLRNTLRFCLQNTADFDFSMQVPLTHALSHQLMADLVTLHKQTVLAAARHDFAGAVTALTLFCETTSADYFNALKDTLYCDAVDAPRRREAQFVLGRLLDFLVRALVPLLPYTAEEVFQLQRERMGYAEVSSLLLTLPEPPAGFSAVLEPWRDLKQEMNRFVETERVNGLKGPAQLDLELTAASALPEADLVDFFGCASVQLRVGNDFSVRPRRTLSLRCPRCRRHASSQHDTLCARCEVVERSCGLAPQGAASAGAAN